MGIEISKRVQDLVEKDGRDFIVDFPKVGDKFVCDNGQIITQYDFDVSERIEHVRLVLKKKPKWPASLSSLSIDAFDVGHSGVFIRDSKNRFCGKINFEALNAEEFKEFEKGVVYHRSDCS